MCHLLTRLPFVFAAGLIIASFSAAAQSPTPAGSWTRKAPMPAVRGEVAAAAVDNKLFALGGGAGGKAVPRNEEYDPASDRWRERAPLPQARDHLGVATYGGKIYTFGGFTSSVHQGAGVAQPGCLALLASSVCVGANPIGRHCRARRDNGVAPVDADPYQLSASDFTAY